jgi:hypothetical protein
MICVGLAISSLGPPWQLYLGHGLFIGFLGNGSINAPLHVYASRWLDQSVRVIFCAPLQSCS